MTEKYIVYTVVNGFKYYVKFLDIFGHRNTWFRLEGLKNNATRLPKEIAEAQIEFLPKHRQYDLESYRSTNFEVFRPETPQP